ncbi:MAG: extracellular solute-binding protein [Clostridia bacterium]|nr:extracellular solute-binding protein [Clostridia bacterium]
MKSTTVRILCLLLTLIMILPLFACGQGEDETPTGASSGAEETETEGPSVKRNDYDCEFNAIYCNDTYPKGYFFMLDEEREPGSDMDDAVYERMERIKDYLGVTINPVEGGNFLEYGGPIKRTIQAGDDEYQMVMTHTYYDVTDFIVSNYLQDFKDFDALQLDADYWDQQMMEEDSLDDHYFLGYNDFCLASVYVLVFNKDMADRYTSNDVHIYDDVRNKKWTLDRMIELSELVAVDNGDGKWTNEDTYGFAGMCWVPMVSFTLSSDIRVIDKDENDELYLSPVVDNSERMIALTTKLFNFAKENCTFLWPLNSGDQIHLTSGQVMFEMVNNYSLVEYKGEDIRFGVLPYPLYDEQQEDYRIMNWNGMLGIPSTIKNEAMVADTIEMLAYFSEPVKTAFFERLLGAKVAEAPDDAEMLDLIWSHQCNDVGMIFSNSSAGLEELFYVIPRLIQAGNDGYMAFYKKREKSISKGLQKIYKNIRSNE